MIVDRSWSSQLRRNYGLTPVEYNKLLVGQNNSCAICGKPPYKVRLSVDHSHISNKVRGLLCFHCNTILGHAYDDIKILSNAVKYLEKYYDPDWDVDLFIERINA